MDTFIKIDKINQVKEAVSSLDSISISHSILSILPYHIAIEYFALPLNIGAKKDAATMRHGEGERKVKPFVVSSMMRNMVYFKWLRHTNNYGSLR
jgi:hypothetical protein